MICLLCSTIADYTDLIVVDPSTVRVVWTIDVPARATLKLTLPSSATIEKVFDIEGDVPFELVDGKVAITIGENEQIRVQYTSSFEQKPYLSYSGTFPTESISVWVPSYLTIISGEEELEKEIIGEWTAYKKNSNAVSFTVAVSEAQYVHTQKISVDGDNTDELTIKVLLAQNTKNQEVKNTQFEPEGEIDQINDLDYGIFNLQDLSGKQLLTVSQNIIVKSSKELIDLSGDGSLNLTGHWELDDAMRSVANQNTDIPSIFSWTHDNINYVRMSKRMGASWAFQNNMGDCNEYSDVYIAFSRYNDRPSMLMEGVTTETGHAWAASYLDGNWRSMDALWNLNGYSSSSHVILAYSKDKEASNVKISYYGDQPEITHDFELKYFPQDYTLPDVPLTPLTGNIKEDIPDEVEKPVETEEPIFPTESPEDVPTPTEESVPEPTIDEKTPSEETNVNPTKMIPTTTPKPRPTLNVPKKIPENLVVEAGENKILGNDEKPLPQKIPKKRQVGKNYAVQDMDVKFNYKGDGEPNIEKIPIKVTNEQLMVAIGVLSGFLLLLLVAIMRR